MDTLERKLKQIPLVKPPSTLRQKIMDDISPSSPFFQFLNQPISLRWALAFAFLTALMGYATASILPIRDRSMTSHNTIEFRVMNHPSPQFHFDVSQRSALFLPAGDSTRIEVIKETDL